MRPLKVHYREDAAGLPGLFYAPCSSYLYTQSDLTRFVHKVTCKKCLAWIAKQQPAWATAPTTTAGSQRPPETTKTLILSIWHGSIRASPKVVERLGLGSLDRQPQARYNLM